jgi:hypothetical protein
MHEAHLGAYHDWRKAVAEAAARCREWGDAPSSALVLAVQARRMRQDCDWLLFSLSPDPGDVYRYYVCPDGTRVLLCCQTDGAPTPIAPVGQDGRLMTGGAQIGGNGPQVEGTLRALLRHLLGSAELAEPLVMPLVRRMGDHLPSRNLYESAIDIMDWAASQTRLDAPRPRGQSDEVNED